MIILYYLDTLRLFHFNLIYFPLWPDSNFQLFILGLTLCGVCAHHSTRVEVRGQPAGSRSLLVPC